MRVLKHLLPPRVEHLQDLLKLVFIQDQSGESLEQLWAFARSDGGELLRFDSKVLYVLDEIEGADAAVSHLRQLRLQFENTVWVRSNVGIAGMVARRVNLSNVIKPDK
jgi:hypothetical protein